MGHWDSYSGNRNNFYLYTNPTTKKLHFIPWGADRPLRRPGATAVQAGAQVVQGRGRLEQAAVGGAGNPGTLSRGDAPDSGRALERRPGSWGDLRTRARRRFSRSRTCGPRRSATAGTRIETFVKGRRAAVEAESTGPAPAWPPTRRPGRRRPSRSADRSPRRGPAQAPANPMGRRQAEPRSTSKAGPLPKDFAVSGAYSLVFDQGGPPPASLREQLHGRHPRRRHQGRLPGGDLHRRSVHARRRPRPATRSTGSRPGRSW